MKICVIGAGIIGLSTARCIQDREPTAQITIVASQFSPDTTSDVAAGHWLPHAVGPDQDMQIIRKWGDVTFKKMMELSRDEKYGVGMCSAYCFGEQYLEDGMSCKDTLFNARNLSKQEMVQLGFPKAQIGEFFTSMYLESSKYLPILMQEFKEKGGRVTCKKVNSLEELAVHNFDTIVNCSGLGSYHLVNDKTMYPLRGQVLKVKAPYIKHNLIYGKMEEGAWNWKYILMNHEVMTLGGTEQKGNWSLKPDSEDTKQILAGCQTAVPALKSLTSYQERVGLRPGRPSVRLECEMTAVGNKMIPVIHNYGHGGSGVTLFWGCALDATDLVCNALRCKSRL